MDLKRHVEVRNRPPFSQISMNVLRLLWQLISAWSFWMMSSQCCFDLICRHHSPDSRRGSSLNELTLTDCKRWPQTSPAVSGGSQSKLAVWGDCLLDCLLDWLRLGVVSHQHPALVWQKSQIKSTLLVLFSIMITEILKVSRSKKASLPFILVESQTHN